MTTALAVASLAVAISASAEPRAVLLVTIDAPLARELTLVSHPRNTAVASARVERDTLQNGFRVTFECVPGVYIVKTRLLISAPVAVGAGGCGRPIAVTLFGRGALSGTVSTPGDMPETLDFDVNRCVKGQLNSANVGRYAAAPDAAGRWRVDIPAECLDVTVSAAGLARAALPRLGVTIGQIVPVGEIRLRTGTRFAVRVLTPDGPASADTDVTWATGEEYPDIIGAILRDQSPVIGQPHARTDVNGAATLRGVVGPDIYVIAWRGRTLGVAGPFVLERETPTHQVQVELRRAVPLGVSLTGTSASRGSGQPLRLQATPRLGSRWLAPAMITRPLTPDTSSQVLLPLPGTWRVELRTTTARDQETVVARRYVTVGSDHSNLLEFESRQYRGTVISASGAAQGTLTLTPVDGSADAVTTEVFDGRFEVALYGAGTYQADFTSDGEAIVAGRAVVDVTASERDLQVRLPAGALTGDVVLPSGATAPRATVTLKRLRTDRRSPVISLPLHTTTNANGGFSFNGLIDGTYELAASSGRSQSVPETVTIAASTVLRTAPIVLRDSVFSVQGRVTTPAGQPMPGAAGTVFVETATGMDAAVSSFTTDMQGYFRANLDRPAGGWMQFTILTRGMPVTAFRVPAPVEKTPVLLQVSPAGGQCFLDLPSQEPADGDLAANVGTYILVNEQGAGLPMAQLLDMRAAVAFVGDREITVVIPALAAGKWRLETNVDPNGTSAARDFTLETNGVARIRSR